MSQAGTQAQMMQLINGFVVSQAIRTVAELEIADKLADGPRTADELAALTGGQAKAIHRVLRALSSIGIFAERDGKFELTPMAQHLRRDATDSVWPAAMFMVSEIYKVLHDLPSAVRAGEGRFERVFGMKMFEYLDANKERGAIFDSMMAAFHGSETAAIVAAYDFSSMKKIVDVGGGNGDVLRAILTANPKVHSVLFDRPDVVRRAEGTFSGDPIVDRMSFEPGDFFARITPGGDAYILRHIIHDWGEKESVQILKGCRAAMSKDSKLLVMEEIIPEGNVPSSAKWLDICFLAFWTGMERTVDEYERLYNQAGFELTRVVPTNSALSIIEGKSA